MNTKQTHIHNQTLNSQVTASFNISFAVLGMDLVGAVDFDNIGDGWTAQNEYLSNNEDVLKEYAPQILQKSADGVYPNKYLVERLDIWFNNFYELPQQHHILDV